MNLLFRSVPLALVAVFSLPAAANSCYVSADTSGAVPPPVVTEKCFEYEGVDDNSIDWVCQDNEAIKNSHREIRDSCPAGHFGVCTAALTPETLANERATGTQADNGTLPTTVPEEARIVTYHYQATDRAQAKIDCESAGGEWSQ
ncbi:hypothetical protein CH92_19645 [Stutzerimonas stutzeri]|uniref:Uncharacterized protein n=1 Tax=Stutzerimonas stutzeri TaxID=316 RepID=W8R3K0_STUST|nr:hypothetical protein [Stutzerimonas stutzeri]AHL77169.1 hypothetical protein CH92_19645 [Stutzerimonas stutzeri]MCQ4330058.1 hypothetical protein [Stutzerimonas stutzeri]